VFGLVGAAAAQWSGCGVLGVLVRRILADFDPVLAEPPQAGRSCLRQATTLKKCESFLMLRDRRAKRAELEAVLFYFYKYFHKYFYNLYILMKYKIFLTKFMKIVKIT